MKSTKSTRKPALTAHDAPEAVALYARVSTDDQAENDTIDAQLDFLRNLATVYGWPVAGEYVDEGVSGTVPFAQRPEGSRLLTDAEAGRFGTVVLTRVSRLGRKLDVTLDAYKALDAFGIGLRFAQESIDTTQPAGELLFGILGSFAQHDHRTIVEQTSRGRNRVAAKGAYTGGPIAVGFDLDDENNYVLSTRPVPQLGEGATEATMMRGIFERVAARQTTAYDEFRRLIALGVPRYKRYGRSAEHRKAGGEGVAIENPRGWDYAALARALRNPIYKGEGVVKSRFGTVVRPVPALVDAGTWARVQEALIENRRLARKNAKRDYWLRGLIRCGCGAAYTGCPHHGKRRYQCTRRFGVHTRRGDVGCRGKALPAEWLESAVWEECRRFILDPGEALDEARKRLREKMAQSTGFEDRRRVTLAALAEKETERERVITLYRKGRIDDEEADRQLDAIAREAGQLREDLEAMRAQAALIDAQEATLTEGTALLATLREELADIEAADDWARRGAIMARFVRAIEVETRRVGPRRLEAEVRVWLRLRPEASTVDLSTSEPTPSPPRGEPKASTSSASMPRPVR
jgi:site-specific DNA recombinase